MMMAVHFNKEESDPLIEQLCDPSQSNKAILGLLARGKSSVPALVAFLRTSKPATIAEPRLLAVEGLSILKGDQALGALIEVATERLEEIPDAAVRLAEETVASRAALALADFADASARDALLGLLHRKPLVGVAEAFEKLRDYRAIPSLIGWLEEDFVSESSSRAILAVGRVAVPHLLASLEEKKICNGSETGMSQRRRARILEILADLARTEEIAPIQNLLQEPAEAVRFKAVQLFVRCGTLSQKMVAYASGLALLDSRDNAIRSECEALLATYFHLGSRLVEEEIERRRALGESAEPSYPRETTLATLVRIARNSGRRKERPR